MTLWKSNPLVDFLNAKCVLKVIYQKIKKYNILNTERRGYDELKDTEGCESNLVTLGDVISHFFTGPPVPKLFKCTVW